MAQKVRTGRLTKAEIEQAGGIKQAWAARYKAAGGKAAYRQMAQGAKVEHPAERKPTERRHHRRHHATHRASKRAAKSGTRRARHHMVVHHRARARHGRQAMPVKSMIRRKATPVTSMIVSTPRGTTKMALVPIASVHRHRSHKVRHKGAHKGGHKPAGYAMENPLSGGEIVVGGFTALLGFFVSDGVDRMLATHPLTDTGNKDSNGNELYVEAPTSNGSAYDGMNNAEAILAPYNAARWIVGGVVTAVPIITARFLRSPMGRSALQMFGFGYGVRWLGKALVDGVASLTKTKGWGQRLYVAEQRAASLKAGSSGYPLTSLVSTGLGSAQRRAIGAGLCSNCSRGLPCAYKATAPATQPTTVQQAVTTMQQPPASTTSTTSMTQPTQPTQPGTSTTQPAPTPPFQGMLLQPASAASTTARGSGTSGSSFTPFASIYAR